jgi:hypothetical protein
LHVGDNLKFRVSTIMQYVWCQKMQVRHFRHFFVVLTFLHSAARDSKGTKILNSLCLLQHPGNCLRRGRCPREFFLADNKEPFNAHFGHCFCLTKFTDKTSYALSCIAFHAHLMYTLGGFKPLLLCTLSGCFD